MTIRANKRISGLQAKEVMKERGVEARQPARPASDEILPSKMPNRTEGTPRHRTKRKKRERDKEREGWR